MQPWRLLRLGGGERGGGASEAAQTGGPTPYENRHLCQRNRGSGQQAGAGMLGRGSAGPAWRGYWRSASCNCNRLTQLQADSGARRAPGQEGSGGTMRGGGRQGGRAPVDGLGEARGGHVPARLPEHDEVAGRHHPRAADSGRAAPPSRSRARGSDSRTRGREAQIARPPLARPARVPRMRSQRARERRARRGRCRPKRPRSRAVRHGLKPCPLALSAQLLCHGASPLPAPPLAQPLCWVCSPPLLALSARALR